MTSREAQPTPQIPGLPVAAMLGPAPEPLGARSEAVLDRLATVSPTHARTPRRLAAGRPLRVVIVGGGVAALEAVLALSETAAGYVTVDVVSPHRDLIYAPLAVAEPFELAERRVVDLEGTVRSCGAHFVDGALAAVDVVNDKVVLQSGDQLGFDALLLATGARPTVALPGALTFGTGAVDELKGLLRGVAAGELSRIAFTVPEGVNWSLPVYELALMTAAFAAGRGRVPELHVVTPERRALDLFGPATSARIEQLLERAGISLHTGQAPIAVHRARLLVIPMRSIPVERVVAMPRLSVPPIHGLPQVAGGFVPVDEFGLVEGLSNVYAAGDMVSYPTKQGGLATQQADAAASAIAAAAGAPVEPQPFDPVLRGVLLTGEDSEYLRGPNGRAGVSSADALWWPPVQVAGRYLGPFLAGDERLEPLRDVAENHHPGLDLALAAADAAAEWEDYPSALRWLEVAEQINTVLPSTYAERRRHWRAGA